MSVGKSSRGLQRVFLGALSSSRAKALETDATLPAVLDGIVERCAKAWPDLEVDADGFIAWLAKHWPHAATADDSRNALQLEDMYLAYACGQGNPQALRDFEKRLKSEVPKALFKMNPSATVTDEVLQLMRKKLLLSEDGNRPKILDYAGRGPLRKWLRATALRTATTLFRQDRREVPIHDQDSGVLPLARGNPEFDYIRTRYGLDFDKAFVKALAKISPRERTVLRLHLIDGLNFAQIAQLYSTHRSTVTRWIQSARQTLLDETRQNLVETLGVSRSEFDSLVRFISSQIDISIGQVLKE